MKKEDKWLMVSPDCPFYYRAEERENCVLQTRCIADGGKRCPMADMKKKSADKIVIEVKRLQRLLSESIDESLFEHERMQKLLDESISVGSAVKDELMSFGAADKKEGSSVKDAGEYLLKVHRDSGYGAYIIEDVIIITTRRTSAKRVVGVFNIVNGYIPIKAMWTACDIDDGKSPLLDYEAIDVDDPKKRDKLDHGVYYPERGEFIQL